jgi:hypothetical protein
MTTYEFNKPTLNALGNSYFPEDPVQAEFRSNSELSVCVVKLSVCVVKFVAKYKSVQLECKLQLTEP